MTHMRRQLRTALVDALGSIDGVRVLCTHRASVAAALADQGQSAIMVYPIADQRPERISNAGQGPRPTWRGFVFAIAIVVADEDAEDGRLDEISVEVERIVFRDPGIRALATRDVQQAADGEHSIIASSDRACVLLTPYEFVVPMTEGAAVNG